MLLYVFFEVSTSIGQSGVPRTKKIVCCGLGAGYAAGILMNYKEEAEPGSFGRIFCIFMFMR
jgi:hypothetical protein